MKNKKGIVIGIVMVLLLLVVGIFMAINVFPTVKATIEITNALQPYLEAENQSMHFDVDAEVEDKSIEINADIYATKEENKKYLIIEQENMCFYVVDNLILLENGKAFLLSEDEDNGKKQMPNSMEILPLLAVAFEEFSIQRNEADLNVQYEIEITGEQVKKILEASIPSKEDIGASVEYLQVQLVTQSGELDEIRMTGKGSAKDSAILLDVVLSDFNVLEDGEYPIPQLIKDSVQNVDKDKLFCLTEDLYPLLKAVKPLTDINNLQGIMTWKVSCGLIQINNSMDLERLN